MAKENSQPNYLDYAFLSQDVYSDSTSDYLITDDWERLDISVYTGQNKSCIQDNNNYVYSTESGYQGAVYKNKHTGEIVIAHRGTEFEKQRWQDFFATDGTIALGSYPTQMDDALQFTQVVEKEFPNAHIVHTGHSLGGFLAEVVARQTGGTAVTFDQPGLTIDQMNNLCKRVNLPSCGQANITQIKSRDDVVNLAGTYSTTPIDLSKYIPDKGLGSNFISNDFIDKYKQNPYKILTDYIFNSGFTAYQIDDLINRARKSYLSLDYHKLDKTIIPALIEYESNQNADIRKYIKFWAYGQAQNAKDAEVSKALRLFGDIIGTAPDPQLKTYPWITEQSISTKKQNFLTNVSNNSGKYGPGSVLDLPSQNLPIKSSNLFANATGGGLGKYGDTYLTSGKNL